VTGRRIRVIFYFSGTGNSKHIAERIADKTGETMVFMSQAEIKGDEVYEIREHETIGFVFPVYWYTLPKLVERFVKQLHLSGYQNQYMYAIATYGFSAGNVMDRLEKVLKEKKLKLDGAFGVKMVDNYVVGYDIVSLDKQKDLLDKAEVEIEKIIPMIEKQESIQYLKKGSLAFASPLTGYAYRKTDHIKKFHVTQSCNGCRQCATQCPCDTIEMVNGKPVWTGDCTFCLKCIHGCKQRAVQYGRSTEKRERYQYSREA
jgi:flavodoxin/NAD-dependent dihydropyrimidine dehydrogenase PreA subunit